MTDPERRRRRPAISCTQCRKRKIRCNREIPCSNCMRSRHGAAACFFENPPPQTTQVNTQVQSGPFNTPHHHDDGSHASSTNPMTVDIASSISGVTPSTSPGYRPDVVNKIRNAPITLADVLPTRSRGKSWGKTRPLTPSENSISSKSATRAHSPVSSIEISSFNAFGPAFHIHSEALPSTGLQLIPRGLSHKSRLFGQSHWATGIAMALNCGPFAHVFSKAHSADSARTLERCKDLARQIKAQCAPSWPLISTVDLPDRAIADCLVAKYINNNDTIHRVLHIPSFYRDYEALWSTVPNAKPKTASLILTKLVMAIGASMYDDEFSLRRDAVHWLYEAHSFLANPHFKSRLDITSVQIRILELYAREAVGIDEQANWITAGSLMRSAMLMGFHRDPSHLPSMPLFMAEMRRRLWNTLIELCLASSIASGGPPLLRMEDFDTKEPMNIDDETLDRLRENHWSGRDGEGESSIVCESDLAETDELTDMSAAIALRRTFSCRLAITRFLNNLDVSGVYEETLRHDTVLRADFKTLRQTIHKWQSRGTKRGRSAPSFALLTIDLIMQRYLLSLHLPYLLPGLNDPGYAFSRSVAVDAAFKMWRSMFPTPLSIQTDVAHLATCGSGFYRIVAVQSCLVIAIEISAQLQRAETLCPTAPRQDLLDVVSEGKEWALKCVRAGETNVKGYLVNSVYYTHIECLRHGMNADEASSELDKVMIDIHEVCLPILEEMAAAGRNFGPEDDQPGTDTVMDAIEAGGDWDFMMSDALLFPGSQEPLRWLLP